MALYRPQNIIWPPVSTSFDELKGTGYNRPQNLYDFLGYVPLDIKGCAQELKVNQRGDMIPNRHNQLGPLPQWMVDQIYKLQMNRLKQR
jgi:hypothetical protein